ncbi:unnamed protein product [Acanthoscelides obtectus]|uniref:Dynein axonemal intermediate chain 4 n=1 Tax=Acanthoscelides obtectus TaxID=200917 RepID=A0A9P0KJR5_ACAOB|nr:unnamed protein product [Acanthoscelides obtectus]CAK1665341.1 WD repeat-containing protein 34 [Acanthoscelides obtectus]
MHSSTLDRHVEVAVFSVRLTTPYRDHRVVFGTIFFDFLGLKSESTKDNKVFDPLSKYYEPHDGEVTSISFSPMRSEMFMTCGTDGELRIYLIGQEEPAQVIFLKDTLLDVVFVPYEEKLIAGCGLKGMLEIFNVVKGQALDDVTTEDVKKTTLTKLAVNKKKTNIVALGSTNGELQLWSVPWILFSIK